MIVTQAELDLILNPKIRRRQLYLPIRYGPQGERKKCPAKPGHVYRVRARVPYEEYLAAAKRQPSRARAVLALIASCEVPVKTVVVTVRDVAMVVLGGAPAWSVTFEKGDHSSTLDQPVFLARHGDYTMQRSEAVRGEPEVLMPFAKDLERARARALERRVSPERAALRQRAGDARSLQQSMRSMKVRALVRRAQRTYEAAERLLLSEEAVDSREGVAPDGSQGEEDRPRTAMSAVASLDGRAVA